MCSAPNTRCADGQQYGELVAGPVRVARKPGPAGQVEAGVLGKRVLRAGYPLDHGQQRGGLVAGSGSVSRFPGPAGQVGADDQRVRVLGARHLLANGQQRGQLVAGPVRVARKPGPKGQVVTGSQSVRVLGSENPSPCFNYFTLAITGGPITAAVSEIGADSLHAITVRGERRQGVWQQQVIRRPGLSLRRVIGERGLDHGRGGPLPGGDEACGHLVDGDRLHQPVHRYRPVGGRGDQRIPAQRRDHVPGRQLVLQQGHQHRRDLPAELPGQARAGL